MHHDPQKSFILLRITKLGFPYFDGDDPTNWIYRAK